MLLLPTSTSASCHGRKVDLQLGESLHDAHNRPQIAHNRPQIAHKSPTIACAISKAQDFRCHRSHFETNALSLKPLELVYSASAQPEL
jgi:hypothetical protein